ncbi:MAG: hypothetical protein AAFU79_06540 [Myxococcota bacterium]
MGPKGFHPPLELFSAFVEIWCGDIAITMFSPVPRRSLLFVPGSKARALEKAANLPVDAVI